MNNLEFLYKETWDIREEQLKRLGFNTYNEYLESPYWTSLKKKTSQRLNYKECEVCGDSKINLHHSTYKWLGTKRELSSIKSLCDVHHSMIHSFAKEVGCSIRISTNVFTAYSDQAAILQGQGVNSEFKDLYKKYCSLFSLDFSKRRSVKLHKNNLTDQ